MSKRKAFTLSVLLACAAALVFFEIVGLEGLGIHLSELEDRLVSMTVTRALGGGAFLVVVAHLGYGILDAFKRSFWKDLLFCIPAFAVVINNLHIYTILDGRERVTGGIGMILLLALECFCIALFEEMAFRGVVFLSLLEGRRKKISDVVISIIISSAIFGLIHAVNFFTSSPLAVVLQIGYSFLIGGMCSVVLLYTSNIWLCVALHTIYNFCGALVPTLGEGYCWDTPTVIFTSALAVATTVYMLVALRRLDLSRLDRIYCRQKNKLEFENQ